MKPRHWAVKGFRTPLSTMSVRDKETRPDRRGPTGNAVVFSNPLMSDYESDWSQMHDAAFNGHVLTLRRLISQINSPTVDGHTALTEACARGHEACVSVLLQHGAASTGTTLSSSPIHRAAATDNVECIEQLVQFGADVDQHIDQTGSPLQIACRHQQPNTVRKLLQLGANVNSVVSGEPALHTAVRLSCPEMVSTLLERGRSQPQRPSRQPAAGHSPSQQPGGTTAKTKECSLLNLCRVSIRRTVGKNRLSEIHDLQIPNELKHYLLHQSEPRLIKSH
ncbi:hypothetical protein NQD34_015491 [Periophthalmus magnuspinnatus]|nr:hypothetical protein NQD34_015491 [Periophthalmus magnuspinnatus]